MEPEGAANHVHRALDMGSTLFLAVKLHVVNQEHQIRPKDLS
jgi:hypothetical protein